LVIRIRYSYIHHKCGWPHWAPQQNASLLVNQTTIPPHATLAEMKRQATAEWKGGLKDGKGTISTGSGVLSNTQYSFGARFEQGTGTNPEELVAAAHAGCFAMALSAQLGEAGITPESLKVTATVSLDKQDGGWSVTSSHLDLVARVPGADRAKFDQAAKNAKEGCPISKLLKAEITLNTRME
jgi:osmotically inducible protein OsmC